ncbi:MAG: exonuclease SbcCD subunit D, partial [Methylococcaceae bacterium]
CWCLAVPFLRASDLPKRKGEAQEGDDYTLGVTELYRQAEAKAEALREKDQAIIALGHCHLRGGLVSSDSERRILIGGCEALSASIFGSSLA